jgi:hypothetical protein
MAVPPDCLSQRCALSGGCARTQRRTARNQTSTHRRLAADPFYNTDSSGLIIYDPSGWMSVQIVGQPRPAMDAPASRPSPATARIAPEDAQLKAAVLDTYYAYFGTWEFDEATSTVTHSVKASLIPGETGLSYSQTATLDGGQLIFTVRQETPEGAVVRKKIWKRIVLRPVPPTSVSRP